jgi:hypothetical protein
MSTIPRTTMAWLINAADAGQHDAKALLRLIARADAQDQWFAKFTDHYSKTIAALCRRLEALELVAGLRHPVEDAETTESDLAASSAPAAPVNDGPVADALIQAECAFALIQAECALADIAEGMPDSVTVEGCEPIEWAETRCAQALAVIRRVMQEHGIRTSEFPPAAPAPAAPTSRPTALVEVVGNELPLLPGGRVDEARARFAIHKLADWLDTQGDHGSANCLRRHINR